MTDNPELERFIKHVNEKLQAMMAIEFTEHECKQIQVTVGNGQIHLAIVLVGKELLKPKQSMVAPARGGPFQA